MSIITAWFGRKWAEYKKNFDLLDEVMLIALLSYFWIMGEFPFTLWVIALMLLFIQGFLSNNTSHSTAPWRSKPIPKYYYGLYLFIPFGILCLQHRLFTACYLLLALNFIIVLIIANHENKLKKRWRKEREAKLASILEEYKSSLDQSSTSGNPVNHVNPSSETNKLPD